MQGVDEGCYRAEVFVDGEDLGGAASDEGFRQKERTEWPLERQAQQAWVLVLIPVIPATQEAEIGGSQFEASLGK
jgi:hypothetical protein